MIINCDAILNRLAAKDAEETFKVTDELAEELADLAEVLADLAEETPDPAVAARQREVASACRDSAERFGCRMPVYQVGFPGGHRVTVRTQEEDKTAAYAEAKKEIVRQAARRSSPLGQLILKSRTPLPVGHEPVSAVRIG